AALEGSAAHITSIAVKEDFRRRGVGTAILSRLFERSKERGATSFTLELRRSNDVAFKFYSKLGFTPSFIIEGYYDEGGEDAIVMVAPLSRLNLKGRRIST
ncbi:MAG: GNAT family N-acetyltransferase, partial [Actinomycetota bacterium]|nr:GNAT family N-acetyltransferase [Actinomycetota bacterium]